MQKEAQKNADVSALNKASPIICGANADVILPTYDIDSKYIAEAAEAKAGAEAPNRPLSVWAECTPTWACAVSHLHCPRTSRHIIASQNDEVRWPVRS